MPKKIIRMVVGLVILGVLGIYYLKTQEALAQRTQVRQASVAGADQSKDISLPFAEGEFIKYQIKKTGVSVGEATLTFSGRQKVDGKEFYLIVFTAESFNFFDEEKIYADTNDFYPLIVKRDLNIFGKKEKITEEYDRKSGVIKVTKTAGSKTSQQVIHKPGLIDNIYCFIYRCRASGQFRLGDSFNIRLPTADVKIDLVKTTKLKTSAGTYDAYFMESNPAKYRVWFDQSADKIPLRIDGAVGIGSTSMMIAEYKKQK
ncbi:MAG TPA: DUF3108 domain-containing protein [Candidatus Omnitrophota bacterium]|nr:DUF3108 domain-containing protein [Candidatus Omnitrophota bacterium]HPD85047.1 DUF3108 domain-containing protein [Candidatus Omnitrophota bacterium]HRZ03905.1 DUF3108 domain-containing protein [Candidatus Omnitrophota bacterium]